MNMVVFYCMANALSNDDFYMFVYATPEENFNSTERYSYSKFLA